MTTQQSKLEILLTLRDQATRQLSKSTQAVKNHSDQFRKASIFMAGAASVVGGALFLSLRAGREYGNAMDQLSATVGRTGRDFETFKDDILEAASEISQNTDFTEADVLKALTALTDLTGDPKAALEQVGLVFDILAQKGGNLEGRARNIARAVLEGAGELVESTPAIKQAFESLETPAERLEFLLDMFGGAAEANADPINILTSSLQNLMVSLGVYEVIKDVAAALSDFATVLKEKVPGPVLKGIGAALVGLFAVFTAGAVVAGIAAVSGAIIGLAAGFLALSVAGAPVWAVVLAVTALVAGIVLLWKNWDTVWGFIKDSVSTVFGAISRAFESNWGWILPGGILVKSLMFLWDTWKFIWGKMSAFVVDKFGSIGNLVRDIINTLIGLVNGAIGLINKLPEVNILGKTFGIPDISLIPLLRDPDVGGAGKMAKGGIVTRPTRALIGEAGPEAVIPLNRLAGGGVGGGTVNVAISVPRSSLMILDNESSLRRLSTILTAQIRDVLRSQRPF